MHRCVHISCKAPLSSSSASRSSKDLASVAARPDASAGKGRLPGVHPDVAAKLEACPFAPVLRALDASDHWREVVSFFSHRIKHLHLVQTRAPQSLINSTNSVAVWIRGHRTLSICFVKMQPHTKTRSQKPSKSKESEERFPKKSCCKSALGKHQPQTSVWVAHLSFCSAIFRWRISVFWKWHRVTSISLMGPCLQFGQHKIGSILKFAWWFNKSSSNGHQIQPCFGCLGFSTWRFGLFFGDWPTCASERRNVKWQLILNNSSSISNAISRLLCFQANQKFEPTLLIWRTWSV